jgi:TRAP transporter TAXI family solute receptor
MVNVHDVSDGKLDMSVSNIAEATWAYHGLYAHKVPQKKLRVVANLQLFRTALMAPTSANITKVSQLKGHNVSGVFAPDPQLKMLMEKMLASGGLTWEDVNPVPVTGIKDGTDKIVNGDVDAAIGAIGSGLVRKADKTKGVVWLDFDNDTFNFEEYPGYYMVKIPAGTQNDPSVKTEINVIEFPYVLLASEDTSDEVVYEAVKALWNSEKLIQTNPFTMTFYRTNMNRASNGIPFHPAAEKFYKEVGLIK